jgi:hypothetical protein
MKLPFALVQIIKITIMKTKTMKTKSCCPVAILGALAFTMTSARAANPLPSWNDTVPKQAIVASVETVTKEGSLEFVLPTRADTTEKTPVIRQEPTNLNARDSSKRIREALPDPK